MRQQVVRRVCFVLVSVMFLSLCVFAPAQSNVARNQKKMQEAARRSSRAAKVFNDIMSTPDRAIPRELLEKAEAVAVFPGLIKAAFIVGGQGGSGVISRREPQGWSAPVFFHAGGGSVGLQFGATSTDLVLLFMNDDALKNLLEDRFEIGGEASAAAGPVGRTASASTDAQLQAGILSYSRSKGLFAGVNIKGVVISPDDDDNRAVYGKKARDILTSAQSIEMRRLPAGVRIFPQTVMRYSVRRRTRNR